MNSLKVLHITIGLLLSFIPWRQCLSIDKELGTNQAIDVTSDQDYELLPSLESCGFTSANERPKRIVGGRPSSWTKFPWMAQLYFTNGTLRIRLKLRTLYRNLF